MPAATKVTQGARIGAFNVTPEENKVAVTVLTVGGKWMTGGAITLLHVATWLAAIFVIFLWGNVELHNNAANDHAKTLGTLYGVFIVVILVLAIFHASCAIVGENVRSTLFSVVLLTAILFENTLGCAYVAYSVSLNNANLFAAAVLSQFFVCLGSGMMVAFYVNWTHKGDGASFMSEANKISTMFNDSGMSKERLMAANANA